MEKIYTETAKILKALSDPKRLRIVDMLSCGELCACQILEAFHVTQPTLSHDMKLLVEAGMLRIFIIHWMRKCWENCRIGFLSCFSQSRNVYVTVIQVVDVTTDVHIMVWHQLSFNLIYRNISMFLLNKRQ